MAYEEEQIMKAFRIYSILAAKGVGEKDELRSYLVDDRIRGLVDRFAHEVQCTLVVAGEYVYLMPQIDTSIFHVSNESLKKDYFPARSQNADIYLMYVAIIILFGEFYDGYQSMGPTRDFLPLGDWLEILNERISALKEHGEEDLRELEREFSYNWLSVIDKWDAMDDLRENVQSQDARTVSRLSFLNTVKGFLTDQELIHDLGNDELELTEKAKTIIRRYYMEYEFNRGILDVIYSLDQRAEAETEMGIEMGIGAGKEIEAGAEVETGVDERTGAETLMEKDESRGTEKGQDSVGGN